MKKTIAMLIAATAIVAAASIAADAQGIGGGGVGTGGVGAGGFGAGGAPIGGIPGVAPNNLVITNRPGPQQRFRQITLAGRIPTDPAKTVAGAKIVRLSVNGEIVPMTLDTESSSAELLFDPDFDYGRQLYEAILTKPVTVIGDERLRSEISEAASSPPANARVLKIDGFVFDRLSPYMVVRSVEDAN
ncbi:MAG: hypothetical protein Q7S58_04320 [Candidatus Binatus sp.]|uniref:hypothetical protein n=1 Tax=Candidatus Binatus sp. TaxID=2811406 RepID=UPI00271D650C|nr:hypothetical protein [Candidatus Binatus sp.]MDO8431617.1 hypothetical protein [Candidatus Binatus sp.]